MSFAAGQSPLLSQPHHTQEVRPRQQRKSVRFKRTRIAPYLFFFPFGLLFAIFFLAPIGVAVSQSFFQTKRSGLGFGPPTEVWSGFANYLQVLHDGDFFAGVGRVLLYGVVTTPLLIGLSLILALCLDSAAVRFRRFFRLTFFLPYAVPTVIAALLWGFLYDPSLSPIVKGFEALHTQAPDFLGPNSILWSMSNIAIWEWTGYDMIIIFAALQAIPLELYESARLDGCNELGIARHIKIPLIVPTLIMVLLFSIIGTLQLFNEPQILSAISHSVTSNFTPNLYTYTIAFSKNNYDYAAAIAVVLAIVTFLLSFGFLRLTRRHAGV